MRSLRPALSAYLLAVITSAVTALAVAAAVDDAPAASSLLPAVLLFGVAVFARLKPVHLTTKMKVNGDDSALFAAALLLGPLASMLVAGSSVLVSAALRRRRASWYSLGFNASASVLAVGAAAAVFEGATRHERSFAQHPLAAILAAATMYLVQTSLVDAVTSLQLRRDPLGTWWLIHRRDLAQHGALYALGGLMAFAVALQPWAVLLFVVPIHVVFSTLREATRLREQTRQAIYELADLVDRRDPYTHGHSQRVAIYAEQLARRLSLSANQVELVREAARMHDLGKVTTPDRVLHKAGALDPVETTEMHAHAEDGFRLLARLPDFWEGAALVRAHHERIDGSGYPRGLSGDALPIEVGIIAIADAYDAMATDRPYRAALSWTEIREELRRGRDTQWRAHQVDAFIEMIEHEHRRISAEPAHAVAAATA